MSSGAEIRPLSQWDLGDFFPNLKKKNSQSQKRIFTRDGYRQKNRIAIYRDMGPAYRDTYHDTYHKI